MQVRGRPYGAAASGALARASFRFFCLAAVCLALLQLGLLRRLLRPCSMLSLLSCCLDAEQQVSCPLSTRLNADLQAWCRLSLL